MKRKLTSGVLMLTALLTTSTAFYSCKDYDDERIDAYASQHDQHVQSWTTYTDTEIANAFKNGSNLSGLSTDGNEAWKKFIQSYINSAYLNPLTGQYLKDNDYVTKDDVSGMFSSSDASFSSAVSSILESKGVKAFNIGDYFNVDEDGNLVAVTDLSKRIDSLATENSKVNGRVDSLSKEVIKQNLATNLRVDSVAEKTKAIEANLAQLEHEIDLLYDMFRKQVTGVIVQGVSSPVVGAFALPVGIQSNILAGYYGEAETSYNFPSTDEDGAINEDNVFTELDAKVAKFVKPFTVGGVQESKNLGTIYVTVNPNTVDFTGKTLELVNSQDMDNGLKLDTLKKSDDIMTFGVTRSADNGFYETTATVEDPTEIALSFNANGLKGVVSDILSYNDGIDLTNAAAQIYKAVGDLGDAYALKATYTDSLGEHSVYSDYKIGAYSVNPLSYAFMKDGVNLPALRTLPEGLTTETLKKMLKLDELKLVINDITVEPVKDIDTTIVVNLNIEGAEGGKIKVPENINYDKDSQELTYDTKEITIGEDGKISVPIKISMANINALLTDSKSGIVTQVNSTMKDINKQIEKMVNNTLSGAGSYLDTYNSYASKVNSMLKRVYNSVKNINSKLQPVLVYNNNGSYSIMSSTKGIGTPIEYTATDGALVIYPTSYTAELFAPAYKKYLGVTNVWKSDDFSKSAQGDDTDCQAAADKANSNSTNFGEVIDGDIYYAAFQGEKGYTYEIAYGCVDYNGKQAVRKFYVTVK